MGTGLCLNNHTDRLTAKTINIRMANTDVFGCFNSCREQSHTDFILQSGRRKKNTKKLLRITQIVLR